MYLIELFFNIKEKLARKKAKNTNLDEDTELYETCEHIFVPIDSTKTVLGCTKCGFIINVDPKDFVKKNIFEKDVEI